MRNKKTLAALMNFIAFLLLIACSSSDPTPATTASSTVPDVYKKIYGASSVTSDGTYVTIKANALPDHTSVYYATNNALYANFSGTTYAGYTFAKNPNSISSQTLTFKIPVNPKVASSINMQRAALLLQTRLQGSISGGDIHSKAVNIIIMSNQNTLLP
jgi:hypothetical protein